MTAGQPNVNTQAAGETPPSSPPPAPATEAQNPPNESPVIEVPGSAPAPAQEAAGEKAEPTPEEAKTDDFPKKLAIIARREKALTEREKALKTSEPVVKKWSDAEKAVKEGRKLDAIKALGISYEDLTAEAIARPAGDPNTQIEELKKKIELLENKDKKTPEEEAAAKREADLKIVNKFKEDLATHVDTNATKYPLTAKFKRADLVFDTIDDHHAKHGVLLSPDQAAEAVEKFIKQQIEEASSLTQPPKTPANTTPEQSADPAPKQEAKPQAQVRTLTRATVTTTPPKQDTSGMSESARLKAVAAKYNFFKD